MTPQPVFVFFVRPRLSPVILTLAALGVILGGCTSYREKPLSAERSANTVTARSLNDPELQRFASRALGRDPANAWSSAVWDISALTLVGWYYHPDMQVARAQLAAAAANVQIAGERPEPGVTLSPQYTTNPGDVSPWTLGFSIDLPFETAGKRGKRVAVARAQGESLRYQLGATAWQVRSHIRTALLALWAAQRSTALSQQRLDDQAALTGFLEQRLSAGDIALAAITQARIALDQDRLAIEEARKQERLARVQLARALGLPEQALKDAKFDFSGLDRSPPADVPSEAQLRVFALQARPEILGALADYASAEASLRLEVAKQYPDFHFSPGYTWDQGADRWSIGVGFTLPVLNRNRGAIAKAEADRQSAATRFEALQAKTLGDLENARADYLASRESLRLADELAEKQRMQLTAVEGQFKAGAIGRTELVAARIAFDEAQLAQLTLFVQVQTSFGGLQDAVARPLDGSGPSAGSPGAAPSL